MGASRPAQRRVKLSDVKLGAYRAFITAHAEIISRIERDLAEAELIPLTWYDVLIELYEAPKRRMRHHELARAVVLNRSTLSRTADRLERAGLLRREPDPTDRRGSFAVLTEKGVDAMRAAWPVYAQGIERYFASYLNDEEARSLARLFGGIESGLRETL